MENKRVCGITHELRSPLYFYFDKHGRKRMSILIQMRVSAGLYFQVFHLTSSKSTNTVNAMSQIMKLSTHLTDFDKIVQQLRDYVKSHPGDAKAVCKTGCLAIAGSFSFLCNDGCNM